VIFSSNTSKSLSSQETEHSKKRKKETKLPESLQIKGEVNILRGEKYFNFKNPFLCDSIFSPSIIPFQKSFPKSLRKFS
jgi:hypothetical protein